MLIILIDRWQVLSYLIRMSPLNQANHAIWQKSWSTSIVHTVFPWILEVNASKEKKSLSVFVHHSKTKEDDKTVLQRVGFEIGRERQGLLLQSRKMAQRWQSSWRTIETTAESSLTSFLASGASVFGREAVRRATKSREVPRHIKIGQRTVLKDYCCVAWVSGVSGEKGKDGSEKRRELKENPNPNPNPNPPPPPSQISSPLAP